MQKKRDCDFSISDRVDMISQWEFGARLDESLRLRLAAGSSVMDFRPRRNIYRAGDEADCLFAIATGRIKLSRHEKGTAREAVIDILPGGVLIDIPLPHREIASLLGSTRESVTVRLNAMRRAGTIDFVKRKILVKRRESLMLTGM